MKTIKLTLGVLVLLSLIYTISAITINPTTSFKSSGGLNITCNSIYYADQVDVNSNYIYFYNFSLDQVNTISFNVTNMSLNLTCDQLPQIISNTINNGVQTVIISNNISNINISGSIYSDNVFGGNNAKGFTINGNSNPFTTNNQSIFFNYQLSNGNSYASIIYYTVDNSPNGFCSTVTSGMGNFFTGIVVVFSILAIVIIIFVLLAIVKVSNGQELDTSMMDNIFEIIPLPVIFISILVITILVWIIILIMSALCSV